MIMQTYAPALDSAPIPANAPLVQWSDGSAEQPSETVGDGNMPILMSSLDGVEISDVGSPSSSPNALVAFMTYSIRHETSPRTLTADGLGCLHRRVGRFGFAWTAQIRSNA